MEQEAVLIPHCMHNAYILYTKLFKCPDGCCHTILGTQVFDADGD
jgi:hypothetical protein